MTTTWLKDTNGNKCSAEYFGSQRSRRTSTKGKLQMRIEYFDIKANHVACQGDIVLMPLPQGHSIDRSREIKRGADGSIVLAEGEVTGHHHVIGMIQPAYLHDGALARSMPAATKIQDAVAALYEDGALVSRLVGDGVLTTPNLAIGFLTVEHGPVSLNHQEHDTIILPPGSYYVGRQREFNAGEERRVSD